MPLSFAPCPQNHSTDLLSAHEDAARLATEAIANIRTVAAFSLQEPLRVLFQRTLAAPLRQAVTRGHIFGFGIGFCGFLLFSSYAFTFWVQTLIVPQYDTYATTFKVFFIVVMTSLSVSEALSLAPDLAKGGAAVRAFFSSIDRQPAIDPDDPSAELLPSESGAVRGEIELRDVSFAYPTRPDAPLFRRLSLHVPAGSSLALVGGSGSGKSSVVALVERFYDPLGGAVCVDGRDIRRFNLRSLRRHIALVSQEPALFNTRWVGGNEALLYFVLLHLPSSPSRLLLAASVLTSSLAATAPPRRRWWRPQRQPTPTALSLGSPTATTRR